MQGRITTGLGSVAAFALVAGSASAEQTLQMATSRGGGLVMEKQAKHFAEQVEFLTNNEIKIEIFPGGTLGTALKVSETVRNGRGFGPHPGRLRLGNRQGHGAVVRPCRRPRRRAAEPATRSATRSGLGCATCR